MSSPADAGASPFLDAVLSGLSESPKTLPCRFFYDLEGSRLFEQICELPEYYLTRTEDRILRERAAEIVAALSPVPRPRTGGGGVPAGRPSGQRSRNPGVELVELGSGSARKTRHLIAALLLRQPSLHYVPVDISSEMMEQTAAALQREHPGLTVTPLVGEYAQATARLTRHPSRVIRHASFVNHQPSTINPSRRLILFLGSNLGNFVPDDAVRFLSDVRAMMRPGDRFLLGLDLQKEAAVLDAAYDDAQGVTARFNLNLLERINRELGADFVPSQFQHRAFYNTELGRVEMHLVSGCGQEVQVGGQRFSLSPGESIHTENSYKYTLPQAEEMARAAGLALVRTWTDDRDYFSVNLLRPSPQ